MRYSPWQTHRLMLQPWHRTLAIVFFAQFAMTLGFGVVFPFLPLYIAELGSSTGLGVEFLAGLVFSAQAFTMMISSPIFGVLADRTSRKQITGWGMFGVGLTMLMMGRANSAEELIFWRAMQGVVAGGISAATALVAAAVPRQRVGFALGLVQVALWAGVAAGPLLGGVLADARGYHFPFQVTAVLMFTAGISVLLGIREPVVGEEAGGETAVSVRPSFWREWWRLLTTVPMPIIFTLRFMVGLGNMIISPIAPLFIMSLLPNSSNANTLTGLVSGVGGAASTITAVYFGRLGDRIGHRTILLVCAVAAGLFYLPQAWVTTAWQLLLLQALTGAALGGMITAIAALLAQHSDAGDEGSIYGLDSSVFAASRVVAPMLGAGIAAWVGLRSVFTFTGLLFLLTAVMVMRGLAVRVDGGGE